MAGVPAGPPVGVCLSRRAAKTATPVIESVSLNNPFLAEKDRPLVTGHRGVPLLSQENTVAGFRRAVALGIPAVELDVMLTRDGKVVCFHDDDTERLTGEPGTIASRTWDEVSRLRVQRRLNMGVNADGDIWIDYPREERIPLLAEVLAEFKDRLAINIELKPPYPTWSERHVGTATAKVIREAGAGDSVIVTSFDFLKLHALEKEWAGLHSGFAWDDDSLNSVAGWMRWFPELRSELTVHEGNQNVEVLLNALLEANAVGRWIDSTVIAAEHTLIGQNTVAHLRKRGLAAFGAYTFFPLDTRTVRRPPRSEAEAWAEVERVVDLGIDWLETDEPERMIERMGAPVYSGGSGTSSGNP